MNLTDLRELKAKLEIDPLNTQEDKLLLWHIETASAWIQELLSRDLEYKSRTEYYKGTGTQKLVLKNRPVYPNPPAPYSPIQVTYDPNGYFGQPTDAFNSASSEPLVYAGTTSSVNADYTLQIDQNDGSSRSGILIRIGEYWNKPQVRQTGLLSPFLGDDTGSYQVIYTAGYTQDTMPTQIREATAMLVAALRMVWPLGMALNAESYIERSISPVGSQKRDWLLAMVRPLIWPFRNVNLGGR